MAIIKKAKYWPVYQPTAARRYMKTQKWRLMLLGSSRDHLFYFVSFDKMQRSFNYHSLSFIFC